ncbi:IS3 family transposase [Algoriphagus sp.]|uniref:IS3 family transposase n=1 Tax=Algoriphagus sp. TaxID=1872435 RepID=UPI00261A137D|nr:IS3 family transposase [Algoriphagus sp.]
MKEHQGEFAVEKMCRVFEVSRSGFYAWLIRKPSKRALENQAFKATILELHQLSKFRLDSPKLTSELRDRSMFVSRPRVARLMKQLGIRSIFC